MVPMAIFSGNSRTIRQLIDALCDPARRQRAMLGLICVYALAWLVYGVIAKSTQDLNADMAEMVIWTREPALGYPKHPPFLAWVLTLWFRVFPLADWAYTLLAVVTVAAGIWLCFQLAGEWMTAEKRAAVAFLLAVIPFYNFLGLKFDQNSALIPLWALAMWALMRSLDTRHAGWAALAGLAAAAAMLTKYWSVFLLAALLLAAIVDRRRGAYWRSSAPYVTALVFVLAVAPHGVWLVHEDFPPITWVATRRAAGSLADWFRSLGEYSGGTFAYAGISMLLVLVLVLARPSIAAIRDSWFPRDDRRTAMALFWAPLLLPLAAASATRTNLLSLWNTPALNLIPVMMLASPLVVLTRDALARLAAIVAIITALVVLISPLVAFVTLRLGVENHAAYGRLVAGAIEAEWREVTTRPLRLIGGPFTLVNTAAFYVASRPSTYADFSRYLSPWVDEKRIAREGIAIVCPAADAACVASLVQLASRGPAGRRVQVAFARRWLGFSGPPARFVVAVIPPEPRSQLASHE